MTAFCSCETTLPGPTKVHVWKLIVMPFQRIDGVGLSLLLIRTTSIPRYLRMRVPAVTAVTGVNRCEHMIACCRLIAIGRNTSRNMHVLLNG